MSNPALTRPRGAPVISTIPSVGPKLTASTPKVLWSNAAAQADRPAVSIAWTTEKISTAMNAGHEQAVPLTQHLPVHIVYFTAWVNADGSVTYTDDPYKLDEKQKLH